MNKKSKLSELGQAMADLLEAEVNELVDKYIKDGKPPLEIVDELTEGMEVVGGYFRSGEYFLSELVFSAEVFTNAMEKVNPLIEDSEKRESCGKLIIGTVSGDIHDLGKNIVVTLLKCSGFEVIDLGVDVPAERFVEALRESEVPLIGLSALLTTAFDSMQNTVEAIEAAGLRNKVKIMIGGGPTNEDVRKHIGADFYGADAASAVDFARQILT